jgi:glutathionyl-hydroquinone reductase
VQATDEKGGFVRRMALRGRQGAAASRPSKAGRYHLYATLICPWASCALIARKLKRLDCAVGVSNVALRMTEQGWRMADNPALSAYLKRLLAIPDIARTVSIDHIKQGYYSIRALNRADF